MFFAAMYHFKNSQRTDIFVSTKPLGVCPCKRDGLRRVIGRGGILPGSGKLTILLDPGKGNSAMTLVRSAPLFLMTAVFLAASAMALISRAADEPAATSAAPAVSGSTADKVESGDNAWMLTSSALVLMMTGPGLALFYCGLVRKKNVLSTMMQSFALMAIVTLLWGLVEYSLAFGSGNSFIGGLHNVFLRGVGAQPDHDYA